MTKKTKQITIDDLANMIAEGFHGVDKRFEGVETRLDGVENRLSRVEVNLDDNNKRLGKLEEKVDHILYKEIARHDNLIHQLATKTHVQLEY
jgi:hypothetical protein